MQKASMSAKIQRPQERHSEMQGRGDSGLLGTMGRIWGRGDILGLDTVAQARVAEARLVRELSVPMLSLDPRHLGWVGLFSSPSAGQQAETLAKVT